MPMRLLYIFISALVAILLVSCDREVSLFEIGSESELVVYAFPSTDDEYLVTVSLTRPTSGSVGTLSVESVECTTNSTPDEVTFVHAETHYGMPMAIYRVKGHHRSGDRISITVKDARRPAATATTTIPAATPMDVERIDSVQITNNGMRLRFLTTMAPTPEGEGYFATRVTSVVYDSWLEDLDDNAYYQEHFNPEEIYHDYSWYIYLPWHHEHLSIDPAFEPLLNRYTDTNLDAWNEYYKHMYFFCTDDIRSSSQAAGLEKGRVTLHLQTNSPNSTDYIDVQLYTLSREYYLMLRHLNDQLSNELAESGLAQTYSTYSNVRGGFGCVAAYACSHYQYTPPVREGDDIYYGAE